MSGVLAVPLVMAGGLAMDYSIMYDLKIKLQAAADNAALASARELALTSSDDETVRGIAKSYVFSSLEQKSSHEIKVKVGVSGNRKDVSVDLSYVWRPLLIHYMTSEALPLDVTATASLAGSENICVVALDGSQPASLAMTGVSTLEANDCAVYSNSTSPSGISAVNGSTVAASSTYSAGGYAGALSSYKPTPLTDSVAIEDPLIGRAAPDTSGCDFKGVSKPKGSTVYLKPGVYCGGITLKGKTTIELEPGVYVMKDGPLSIGGNSTINGENVGFYFTGNNATFDFGVSTQANLTAPKLGPLAGILFFEDRNSPIGRDFVIRSKDAERFEGTVYLPRGRFVVDKASRVGQSSKWTAIIARQIEIKTGPMLRINSDYAGSDIPVPDGVGSSGSIRLKS